MVGEAHGVRVRPSTASGLLLVAYLIAIPATTPTIWSRALEANSPTIALSLVGTLVALWCVVVIRLVHTVWRQRRGHHTSGGFGWLAGLVLSTTSFIVGPAVVAATSATEASHSVQHHSKQASAVTMSAGLPMALMAKRRRDELRQLRVILEDGEIEEVINELKAVDEELVQRVLDGLPPDDFGIINLERFEPLGPVVASADSPVLVMPVRNESNQWMLAYARPGGTVSVNPGTNLEGLVAVATALHRDGRIVTSTSAHETMRQLALRPSPRVMVLHLGGDGLDEDIARLCVRVVHRTDQVMRTTSHAEMARSRRAVEIITTHVFVRLLQPVVAVEGLHEPFNSDLRRRCIEMTAYLAVHRHGVITGDRLRARVLGGGISDASTRTLANTASAVRRALGTHDSQTRLLPVTPGGHYRTDDVSSDVERFHALVALAQEQPADEFALLNEAVGLIKGEPLSAELRGFEWFLAEGHLARLQRDAEWAALRLAQLAIALGDFDLAYYALERGRLVDPYSDDIVAALARVPRRRDHITSSGVDA
jgi:DNA-binding SARP family transcriptional activator